MINSRKSVFRAICFAAAALTVSVGFAVAGWSKAEAYEKQLEYVYQRSYAAMTGDIAMMSTAFTKAALTNSGQTLALLAAEVWQKAYDASTNLAALPLDANGTAKTAKFLAQAGNYAYSLAKKAGGGALLSERERADVSALAQNAADVSGELSLLLASMDGRGFFDLPSAESAPNAHSGIKLIESAFPEGPSLIYDGPFSEHLTGLVPEITKQPEISAAEAARIAGDGLSMAYEATGDIPYYGFEQPGGAATVTLTKNGGRLLGIIDSAQVLESTISADDALRTARSFLRDAGYGSMSESYYYMSEGILFINYHCTDNDVMLYPDLVQVGVATDGGGVRYFDARGYLSNHKQRKLLPKLSRADAEKLLSSSLRVVSHKLCVIPTDGKNELLCHEFRCEYLGGRECLVYINALTGVEEKLLLLIKDANGVLTN